MTHPPTSNNAQTDKWDELVNQYVDDRYGSIMPAQHRDTVKDLVLGRPVAVHYRPYLLGVLRRVATEVQAVLAAQRPN